MALLLLLAIAKLAVQWFFNNRYDYFRDEFDYLACGDHLAWGYVDHPPLVPALVKLSRILFGDSLRSIRFLAAVASSAAMVLTGVVARELGGGKFAVVLSALAFAIAPIYLSDGSLMTTNAFEPLLWTGCVYFAVLAVKRDESRYWVWFGIVAGLGLEEKYSILVLGLGIVGGLLLTPQRRILANRWLLVGGAAAFVLFLPNLLWNFQNHWPFLELT